MKAFLAGAGRWAEQKTTILGFATIGGIVAAVVAHKVSLDTAWPGLVFAGIAMAMPERTDVQQSGTAVARDLVGVVQQRGMGTSTLQLGADLVTLAGQLHPDAQVVAVQTQVTAIPPSAARPAQSDPAPAQPPPGGPAGSVVAAAPVAALVLLLGLVGASLAGCSGPQVGTALAAGQLVCAVGATEAAMQSTAGQPILAQGASSATVARVCGAIGGIAVSPSSLTLPVVTVDLSRVAAPLPAQ